MKNVLVILLVACCCFPLNAQTKVQKGSVKRSIRMYSDSVKREVRVYEDAAKRNIRLYRDSVRRGVFMDRKALKDSVKREIERYLPVLNERVRKIQEMENPDSVRSLATEIHADIEPLFGRIYQTYRFRRNEMDSGTYYALAGAVENSSPLLASLYQIQGLFKFLRESRNDPFFERLNGISYEAARLARTHKARKIERRKKRLAKRVERLNKHPLK